LLERAATAEQAPRQVPEVAADLRSLERRLAEVERRLAAAAAASPVASAPIEGQIEQRRERRLRLRDLTEQYRARLAAIREQQTDPAARQQAVREALEWYRTQRHAVLAGHEPAAP
jgi:Spy/CpxP family protein refolding chaperone